MSRKIIITSGKGGVGKTTVSANLGGCLSNKGYRTVLIDADIGLNNLDIALGVENRVIYDVIDVIEGRCRVRQALIKVPDYENLYVLPSSHGYKGGSITGQNLKIITESLGESFDFVIVDCPAGVELGFHRAVQCVKEGIVITTPNITSVRDASKAISALASYNINILGIVINMCRGDLMATGDMMNVDEIVNLLKTSPVGVIPDDYTIGLGQCAGNCAKEGEILTSFEILADNVIRGEKYVFDVEKKYRGLFGRLRRDIKRRV